MDNTFSDRLRLALELRSVSQSELVKRTGIGKSTMSQYLSGKYKAKQDNISKIAAALNVSETWLMGISDKVERNIDIKNEIQVDEIPFANLESALQFIIRSPQVSAYGGYDLDKMSEEEIIDFANELSDMFKVMAKRHKK